MAITLRPQRERLQRSRRLVTALAMTALLSLGVMAVAHAETGAASSAQAGNNPDLWLETSFEPGAPYVQAQGVYTLRLYQAISVRELQFHAPDAPLADIRLIGADHVDEVSRDGRRYRVTERRYAVFPFASGELTLADAHVTGVAAPSGPPQPLKLVPAATPITVVPIPPAAGTTAWLPARTLALTETWAPPPSEARTGEALRRTIRIEARGLDAAQLPALEPGGDGFSAHPEAPRLDNRFDGAWNVGTREQSWLIVPTRPGPLTLPALQLPWWDALSHQLRTASLPARTFTVAAGHKAGTPEPSRLPNVDATKPPAPDMLAAPTPPTPRVAPATTTATLSALAAGATLMLAGWRLFGRRRRTASLRQIKVACRRNDPRAARDALLRWSAGCWPAQPPRTLGELARRLPDPGVHTALAELDRHLYGSNTSAWDGRPLLAALKRRKPASQRRGDDLPPLYAP